MSLKSKPTLSSDLVQAVCRRIDQAAGEPASLASLASELGVSPSHLQRVFKARAGISPKGYQDARRLETLKHELRRGSRVTEAMYEAGYSSPSRLYGRAARRLGMTPADYLRGGAGLQVSYSIQPSTLGLLLVAATQKGVCAVRFGDSARDLEQGLMAEYPRARIQRDQSLPWTANLLGWLENTSAPLDLPLDIRGTVFQWRVWEYLLRIPLGQTRSYSQAARDLGQPSATRAVAGACAANPVAVLIPCHRMLRADGALGGYRWGLERKQALLEKEQRTIASH